MNVKMKSGIEIHPGGTSVPPTDPHATIEENHK